MKQWQNGNYFVNIWDASVYIEIKAETHFCNGQSLSFKEFLTGKYDRVIKRNFNQHVLREAIQAVKKDAGQKWNLGPNKIVVTPAQISIGEQDRYGGIGTTFDVKEFIQGTHHDFFKNYLDPQILEEALAYAKNM